MLDFARQILPMLLNPHPLPWKLTSAIFNYGSTCPVSNSELEINLSAGCRCSQGGLVIMKLSAFIGGQPSNGSVASAWSRCHAALQTNPRRGSFPLVYPIFHTTPWSSEVPRKDGRAEGDGEGDGEE